MKDIEMALILYKLLNKKTPKSIILGKEFANELKLNELKLNEKIKYVKGVFTIFDIPVQIDRVNLHRC